MTLPIPEEAPEMTATGGLDRCEGEEKEEEEDEEEEEHATMSRDGGDGLSVHPLLMMPLHGRL